MKRIWILFISLFLIPIFVNAETLTYEVCESGCEYSSLGDVGTAIYNISDLRDKDIIININSDLSEGNTYITIGSNSDQKTANSVLINGNNFTVNGFGFQTYVDNTFIKDLKSNDQSYSMINNPKKITVKNSSIPIMGIVLLNDNYTIKSEEVNLNDVLEIDETSLNKLKFFELAGNVRIDKMNLKDILVMQMGGTLNVYDSEIGKIFSFPQVAFVETNIYNSKFNTLKYKNLNSVTELENSYETYMQNYDLSSLEYDIYDYNAPSYSKTTVYFDKEFKIDTGEEIDLKNALDYFPEDEEITYLIDDDDIASIDNLKLKGLSEGKTYIEITASNGLLVYRVSLKVGEDNLPEQIDKITVRVPITGSKVKIWVLVISIILLTIIGMCTYILINRRKQGNNEKN